MTGPPPRDPAPEKAPEKEGNPREVPCGDHAFDETLVCRCGATWWSHQRLPRACPLDARGLNRGTQSERARGKPPEA